MQKKNKKQLHACKHYQRTEQCCQITEPSQLKMHVEIYTKLLPILFFKCLWKQSNNTGARLGRIQDSPKESTGLQIINRNLIKKKYLGDKKNIIISSQDMSRKAKQPDSHDIATN